jgi:glycosyltransferase involved in cell wall biosynthesis
MKNPIGQVQWDKSRYEVIVVDNGSSDRTAEIAGQKGATVYVKPELTISGLRNYGASQADGEILAFIDADCTVTPGWLDTAAGYLPIKEIVCFGSPPVIPENATWVQRAWFPIRCKNLYGADADWLESMNMFVRRSVFETVHGFDEKLVTCEDYDLSLRLRSIGRLVSDGRIVAVHHGEASSIGHFFRKELWRGTSNFHGLMQHGFSWQELPSIALPVFYVIAAVMVTCGLAAAFLSAGSFVPRMTVALLFVWQAPLFLFALRKIRNTFSLALAMQLYLLLNIYFMARGGAMFQRFRG